MKSGASGYWVLAAPGDGRTPPRHSPAVTDPLRPGIRQLVAIGKLAFDGGGKRSSTLDFIGSWLFPVKWVE
jgi:hypothetical protein